MNDFGRAVYEIARKEFMQHMRTRRVLIIGGAIAVLLFTFTLYFGPNIVENFRLQGGKISGNSAENLVLAYYFGLAIIGGLAFTVLLSIVMTADAVCSEWSNKTIFLLLSKPVSRDAFVIGKFVGNVTTIAAVLGTVFTIDYILMQFRFDGSPAGNEVAAFVWTLLILVLGASAFAAMALFFSTLFRTTIMSMLVSLAMWLLIFPLIGQIGFFTNLHRLEGVGFDYGSDPAVQRWLYFNPAADMQSVASLLIPNDTGTFSEGLRYMGLLSPAPENVGLAVLSLAIYAAVFLAGALFVVRRRNFE
ncbi:MAG: type transport system permease protein [Thermoplasmata archaeon]|jgi:ABC-type transport system involved in multi-copper enzyme maturation permease subunit|nr:type transport system permease protein [Thermoplasmata archaeon]